MSRTLLFFFLLLTISPARAEPRLQIILVGDSTMAPNTGYGEALCASFSDEIDCRNRARGGRSTSSFRAEGLWDEVLAIVRASHLPSYVLIQFGHNDQPGKPGRSTDLATEFPANLERYVAELRAAGGTPVLVTPLVRRQFTDFKLRNDLAAWADATRAVAAHTQTTLLDLNRASEDATNKLGPVESLRLAQASAPDSVTAAAKTGTTIEAPKVAGGTEPQGTPKVVFDYTHVGPDGARFYARIMRDALVQALPVLRPYLRAQ
ncbi:rhamnogalacturonan acetylesterase [Roseiterribacter gracilis]|uniref:Lysophospholipase n=1 Tax=Roseiterribacter gracilis TaxID=2812848 RepID=A0A8S8XFJ9_9PROT|nr:lysophospholipase [Rhodospirillales bacterium TMPK1]